MSHEKANSTGTALVICWFWGILAVGIAALCKSVAGLAITTAIPLTGLMILARVYQSKLAQTLVWVCYGLTLLGLLASPWLQPILFGR